MKNLSAAAGSGRFLVVAAFPPPPKSREDRRPGSRPDREVQGSNVKTKGTTEFPLLSPWLVPSPRYFAKPTQLDRVRLVQVRQQHASRRSGDHRGRSSVVEADHAVFDRAEVTHAALVEYRGRAAHFVGLAGNPGQSEVVTA